MLGTKLAFSPNLQNTLSNSQNRHPIERGDFSLTSTASDPGRVATLVPSDGPGSVVWGVLYEVTRPEDAAAALAHLTDREARKGGYRLRTVAFQPLNASKVQSSAGGFVCAYTFVAEPDNPQYLGWASLQRQARQVAMATGCAGCNADYVAGVARFMASEVPDGPDRDSHVAELARLAEDLACPNRQSRSPSTSLIPQLISPSSPATWSLSSSPSPSPSLSPSALSSLSPSPSPSSLEWQSTLPSEEALFLAAD